MAQRTASLQRLAWIPERVGLDRLLPLFRSSPIRRKGVCSRPNHAAYGVQLRVGLEATAALGQRFTGLPRYTLELARALAAQQQAVTLDCVVLMRFADRRKRSLCLPYPWPVRWYWLSIWPAVPRCDVIHSLYPRLPTVWPRPALVATFHDLSTVSLPWYGSQRARRNTHRREGRAARVADRLIAVSRATKADLEELYGYPGDRIDVVHHGVSESFLSQARVADDPKPNGRPYFVAFGGTPRKNLPRLIEAFAASSLARSFELRIVGSIGDADRDALRRAQQANIECVAGNLDDEAMATLYRRSAGLLFPSLLEGFGLPILEAMACGAPVLTSARPGTAEIAGGHAELVDPDSVDAIAAGIERIATVSADSKRAAALHARSFTWERTARKTIAVYEAALARRRGEGP